MYRFEQEEFPYLAKRGIEDKGGKPIGCWVHHDKSSGTVLTVLSSVEPCGDGGAMQKHVSVAASTFGMRRFPSRKEVRAALDLCGMPKDSELMDGIRVVHAFADDQ